MHNRFYFLFFFLYRVGASKCLPNFSIRPVSFIIARRLRIEDKNVNEELTAVYTGVNYFPLYDTYA